MVVEDAVDLILGLRMCIAQSCEILPVISNQGSHPQVPNPSLERSANHTLNRDTLLKNLYRDANSDKADVSTEINNSGGNVTLDFS